MTPIERYRLEWIILYAIILAVVVGSAIWVANW